MSILLFLCALAAQDADKFQKVFHQTQEQVVEIVGEPAGRYVDDGTTYWLYEDFVVREGKRYCPELVFKRGKVTQINRHPEEMMKRAVAAARKFKDWTPPAEVKEKDFFVADTGIKGKSKREVTGKLGEPDGKKVFNGIEIWVYRKVRLSREKPTHLTIYVEFEDDKVSQTQGS